MNFKDIVNLESRVYSHCFNRLPVAVKRGRGVYLWDVNNKRYLDLFAGVAVNSVGHCHPQVVKAVQKQAESLMHTSNWLYTLPQLELAEKLRKLTGMRKVFFTNDGTGSVEAALKLARSSTGKKEVIAMKGAFHGRSLGSLSLTWTPKYRNPFKPLMPGVKFVEYDNISALRKAITKKTAAVIVEPIQNEGGVIVPSEGFLAKVRDLTEKKDVLLIVDEVSTGFGRTGKMFGFQHDKVRPDIVCLAKSLGGGFPVGAMLSQGADFKPGEHGGTALGNPLACAAANASVDVIVKEKLSANALKMGGLLMEQLDELGLRPHGKGLLLGFEVGDAKQTVLDLIDKRVLTIYSGKHTVRLLPPLIINRGHTQQFLNALGKVLWH